MRRSNFLQPSLTIWCFIAPPNQPGGQYPCNRSALYGEVATGRGITSRVDLRRLDRQLDLDDDTSRWPPPLPACTAGL